MPQRDDEEHEARSIAQEAEETRSGNDRPRRPGCTRGERQREVRSAGDQPLCHRDERRIGHRDLAS